MANYERVPLPLFNSISHLDLGRYFNESYQSGFSGNKYPISMDDEDPRHLIRKFGYPISMSDFRGACWGLPSKIDETPYWGLGDTVIDPPKAGEVQRRKTNYNLTSSGTDVQPTNDGMFISLTQNKASGVDGGAAVGLNGYFLLDDTNTNINVEAMMRVDALDGGEIDKVDASLVIAVVGYPNGYVDPVNGLPGNGGRKDYYVESFPATQVGSTKYFSTQINRFSLDMSYPHMVCNAAIIVQPNTPEASWGGGIARVQATCMDFRVWKG